MGIARDVVIVAGWCMMLGWATGGGATSTESSVLPQRRPGVAVPPSLLTDPSVIFRAMGADESRDPLRGRVKVMLLIDGWGRPRRCAVVKSRGDERVAGLTCRYVLTRARFRPGRDRNGRAIAAVYSLPLVRWN